MTAPQLSRVRVERRKREVWCVERGDFVYLYRDHEIVGMRVLCPGCETKRQLTIKTVREIGEEVFTRSGDLDQPTLHEAVGFDCCGWSGRLVRGWFEPDRTEPKEDRDGQSKRFAYGDGPRPLRAGSLDRRD